MQTSIFNPTIEHRRWMEIIKSRVRIPGSVTFYAGFHGRDRNFSIVFCRQLDVFTRPWKRRWPFPSANSPGPGNNRQIFIRHAKTRWNDRSTIIPVYSIHIGLYLPCQHRARVGSCSRSKGLIFDYREARCLPSPRAEHAGLLLRGV